MASMTLPLALSLIAAVASAPAAAAGRDRMATPPAGTSETRYCMHIEATTGSMVERVKCWTRDEWAEQGVDVDREWASEGVRTIG